MGSHNSHNITQKIRVCNHFLFRGGGGYSTLIFIISSNNTMHILDVEQKIKRLFTKTERKTSYAPSLVESSSLFHFALVWNKRIQSTDRFRDILWNSYNLYLLILLLFSFHEVVIVFEFGNFHKAIMRKFVNKEKETHFNLLEPL